MPPAATDDYPYKNLSIPDLMLLAHQWVYDVRWALNTVFEEEQRVPFLVEAMKIGTALYHRGITGKRVPFYAIPRDYLSKTVPLEDLKRVWAESLGYEEWAKNMEADRAQKKEAADKVKAAREAREAREAEQQRAAKQREEQKAQGKSKPQPKPTGGKGKAPAGGSRNAKGGQGEHKTKADKGEVVEEEEAEEVKAAEKAKKARKGEVEEAEEVKKAKKATKKDKGEVEEEEEVEEVEKPKKAKKVVVEEEEEVEEVEKPKAKKAKKGTKGKKVEVVEEEEVEEVEQEHTTKAKGAAQKTSKPARGATAASKYVEVDSEGEAPATKKVDKGKGRATDTVEKTAAGDEEVEGRRKSKRGQSAGPARTIKAEHTDAQATRRKKTVKSPAVVHDSELETIEPEEELLPCSPACVPCFDAGFEDECAVKMGKDNKWHSACKRCNASGHKCFRLPEGMSWPSDKAPKAVQSEGGNLNAVLQLLTEVRDGQKKTDARLDKLQAQMDRCEEQSRTKEQTQKKVAVLVNGMGEQIRDGDGKGQSFRWIRDLRELASQLQAQGVAQKKAEKRIDGVFRTVLGLSKAVEIFYRAITQVVPEAEAENMDARAMAAMAIWALVNNPEGECVADVLRRRFPGWTDVIDKAFADTGLTFKDKPAPPTEEVEGGQASDEDALGEFEDQEQETAQQQEGPTKETEKERPAGTAGGSGLSEKDKSDLRAAATAGKLVEVTGAPSGAAAPAPDRVSPAPAPSLEPPHPTPQNTPPPPTTKSATAPITAPTPPPQKPMEGADPATAPPAPTTGAQPTRSGDASGKGAQGTSISAQRKESTSGAKEGPVEEDVDMVERPDSDLSDLSEDEDEEETDAEEDGQPAVKSGKRKRGQTAAKPAAAKRAKTDKPPATKSGKAPTKAGKDASGKKTAPAVKKASTAGKAAEEGLRRSNRAKP